MKRVSKEWKFNPRIDIKEFDQKEINKDNLVNELLLLTQKDITYSFIMNLFGSFGGKSLANPYDIMEVPAKAYSYENDKGKKVSNTQPFTTTLGIWIFNIFFIRDFGFGKLFGYINKTVNAGLLGDINQTLTYALAENRIDSDTYIKFLDYTLFFMPFETVFGANHTEAVMRFSKTVEKKKSELVAKYKDQLDAGDYVIAEKIEKELIEYAKTELKDDPGLDVYLSGAGGSLENNFKNMYLIKGMCKDPDPNAKQQFNFIESSFLSGIKSNEYTTLANSLAAGPYARAKKTELGGYWEKLFTAALQTITLDPPGSDCGTTGFIKETLTSKNINNYMYNYIIKSNGELEELTTENKDKYIDKEVKMRFCIFCKSKTGICNKCAGNLFYRRNSRNIGLACTQIPSTLKVKSMKDFHDSTIKVAEMDPMKAFGFK